MRKEAREGKLRDQQSLHTAAMEFVEVSSDILMTTIDIKGIWSFLRDAFSTTRPVKTALLYCGLTRPLPRIATVRQPYRPG
ncbi:hypothetical protein [Mycobacteroides abscessus]|uniref:hypothetical protein n=1 Tax=Mycobacteroides abscessus TaxID=36809 RepID=UPI00078CF129|nr:hypothetical protein [Mycobacteroides abscessus]AMU22960.1 hypothetical protein A3N95_20665 [Mycobacteroides abscessus]MDO3101240.1 hypothetical protein [Mycobacteroides abscessus subsp. abscessus]PVA29997.1 hypothetical protein DDJ88_16425 [Mycobacteroides abscessus]PVA48902.1 hypothetical protein DDJ35_11575 [Mycobacteroides abscessus]RIQ92774.1 hypothetical protein D2E34_06955 [Mycobacteroides abscessus]